MSEPKPPAPGAVRVDDGETVYRLQVKPDGEIHLMFRVEQLGGWFVIPMDADWAEKFAEAIRSCIEISCRAKSGHLVPEPDPAKVPPA